MSLKYAVFCSPKVHRSTQESLLKAAFEECGLKAKFYSVKSCVNIGTKIDADVLVAAGGDGTVNSVAAQAYQHKKILGVVSMGTLNHFAKDLGLPLVMLQSVKVIAHGTTKKIDVGTVNKHIFLNNTSLGIYPDLVRTRSKLEKTIGKWPAALVAAIYTVRNRLRLLSMQITIDSKVIKRKSSLLFVGNNVYSLHGVGLPSRNKLSDGKLNMFILKTERVDRIFKTALYSANSNPPPARYIERMSGKRIKAEIHSKKTVWIACDGEVFRVETPLTYEIRPKALTVISG